MRRTKLGLLAALAAASMLSVAPAASAAPVATAAAGCQTVYWGSLSKTSNVSSSSTMANIRTGRHTCFDRMVIDLSGNPDGYSVKYVSALTGIGSGKAVPTTGGAKLEILLKSGTSTSYRPGSTIKTLNYTTFRQQLGWEVLKARPRSASPRGHDCQCVPLSSLALSKDRVW